MVTTSKFEWTRFDTLGVATHDCAWCDGLGLLNFFAPAEPCACVLRSIFRACYGKFIELAREEKPLARRAVGWARRDEEFMADFAAIAKRALGEDLHRLFRIHFLLGASAEVCIRRMGGDGGAFYHAVSRIEPIVGRALRETQPYALFPIEDYFRPLNGH